jgi:hypothetical protein
MTAPSPIRRFLWPRSLAGKAGVVAVIFGAVLVSTYLIAVHYTAERLEAAWKLSEVFGLPSDVESLLGPGVPADENMAVPLDEAAGIVSTFLVKESLRRVGLEFSKFESEPEFVATAVSLLKDSRYETLLKDADARTQYRSPIVATRPLPTSALSFLEPRRDLVHFESAIARSLVAEGKSEVAIRRLLRVARLTRRWEDKEPLGVGPMINLAIRCQTIEALHHALRSGTRFGAAIHDEVEREMAANEAIVRSHLLMLQAYKLEAADGYDGVNPLTRVPLFQPFANNDRTKMLILFHRLMKAAEMPGHEGNAEALDVERELKQTKGHSVARFFYVGTTLLLPATMRIRGSFDRTIAMSRCLRVVNAWSRRGDFHAELDSLGLPAHCLVDPYDGKRLRVKSSKAGPTIYSVGENRIDDGGNLLLFQDIGLEPIIPTTVTK